MNNLSRVKIIVVFLGVLFASFTARGQIVSPPDTSSEQAHTPVPQQRTQSGSLDKKNEYTFWIGLALNSFQFWGQMKDVHIQSLGFQYNRKLLRFHNTILEYNLLTNLYSNFTYQGFEPYAYRSSLTGIGISPLGLQLNFLSHKTAQPFINTSAGLMFMGKPFPDVRGKKMNFTLSAGAGLEIMLSRSVSLSLGIKYHHLSNGSRGQINPGVDTNIYYTSVTIF